MPPSPWDDAARIFAAFHTVPLAIVGSYPVDPAGAHDIDCLTLLSDWEWKALCGRLGARYSGFDIYGPLARSTYRSSPTSPVRHLRVATTRVAGVARPVQLLALAGLREFDEWPYATLLRDGELRRLEHMFRR